MRSERRGCARSLSLSAAAIAIVTVATLTLSCAQLAAAPSPIATPTPVSLPPSLSPASLTFNPQRIGATSVVQKATLTNGQNVPLHFSSVTADQPAAPPSMSLIGTATRSTQAPTPSPTPIPSPTATVDATTLNQKLLMGYQGWHTAAGDSSPLDNGGASGWDHWAQFVTPSPSTTEVDFWPDNTELGYDELFPTNFTYPDGSNASLWSNWNQKTTMRHFRWMRDNNLDGVFLQRFISEVGDPRYFALRNRLAQYTRAGAEKYGRVFAIEYDITGYTGSNLVSALETDWNYMVNTLHITSSPNYLHHNGKPVIVIYGFGYFNRPTAAQPATPAQAAAAIAFFKSRGLTVVGQTPIFWQLLGLDSLSDPAWTNVYLSYDVISPWFFCCYNTDADVDNGFLARLTSDVNFINANASGVGYMPVVHPGFSFHNEAFNVYSDASGYAYNQEPRRGGDLYWRQIYDAISAGTSMIYSANFDELEEGTAMFKMGATAARVPTTGGIMALNIDGYSLPSDWYLQLANQASEMLKGQITLTPTIPIAANPNPPRVSFVAATRTTTLTQTVPANVQNSDLLLAHYSYYSRATANAPSGWTMLTSASLANHGAETVWYRFASNDTPGSTYIWSFSSAAYQAGGMVAYRGVDPAAMLDGSCTTEGISLTPTLCELTTSHAGDTYVGFFSLGATGFALPLDLANRASTPYAAGVNFGAANLGAAVGDMTLVAAGPVGDKASMNFGGWATVAVALKALGAP